jgi:phosphatidylinositol alpha 1,6-mannosyltransferase
MSGAPRVAFFTDAYHEVNGVARTSRSLVAYAAARQFPMLAVHAGWPTGVTRQGSVTHAALERGMLSFGLDRDLRFDLRLWRHRHLVTRALDEFRPDLVHVTGPSDVGQLGALLAHTRRLPLVASWHTNLHDFAALRLRRLLRRLPDRPRDAVVDAARRQTLRLVLDFYRLARRALAPNPELVELIEQVTGRRTDLMPRGVDTELFAPTKRPVLDGTFRIGYVGRLSPEKNVRMLADIERILLASGCDGFKFIIVGDGAEKAWLETRLQHAFFPGVLTGDRLAAAYASLDLFVFPSDSDTFGNVVLEALASGVPAAVIARGGPKFIVKHGRTGFLAADAAGLADAVRLLKSDPARLAAMRAAARAQALETSWSQVFDNVYESYRLCLATASVELGGAPPGLTRAARLVTLGVKAFHVR